MKKMLKRFIAIFMAVCMFVSLATVAGAVDDRTNIEFVIYGDVDKEKAQLIIDSFNGEEIQTRANLVCLLLGHSITPGGSISETVHYYFSTSPKCLRRTYNVEYCTRSGCEYINFILIGQVAVYCCS